MTSTGKLTLRGAPGGLGMLCRNVSRSVTDSKENSMTVPPRRCLDPDVFPDVSEKHRSKSLGRDKEAILLACLGDWTFCPEALWVLLRGATGGLLDDEGPATRGESPVLARRRKS